MGASVDCRERSGVAPRRAGRLRCSAEARAGSRAGNARRSEEGTPARAGSRDHTTQEGNRTTGEDSRRDEENRLGEPPGPKPQWPTDGKDGGGAVETGHGYTQ